MVIDEVCGCKLYLEGGVFVINIIERGLVVDINGGWMFLKEMNG